MRRSAVCLSLAFALGICFQFYLLEELPLRLGRTGSNPLFLPALVLLVLGGVHLAANHLPMPMYYGSQRRVSGVDEITTLDAEMAGKRLFSLILIFFLAGTLRLSAASLNTGPLVEFAGEQVMIRGTILQSEENDGYGRLLVKAEAYQLDPVHREDQKGVLETGKGETAIVLTQKILVRVKGNLDLNQLGSGTDAEAALQVAGTGNTAVLQTPAERNHNTILEGREVILKGLVELPEGSRNPGSFHYGNYLKSTGVEVIVAADSYNVEIGSVRSAFPNRLALWKQRFIEKTEQAMQPLEAGLLCGMLLGDKSRMDESVYESFQKNGAAHILAVSGIHAGLIYGYLSKAVARIRHWTIHLLIAGCLAVYAALAGFSPSVVRAVLMISISMLQGPLKFRYDLLSSCSLTLFLMLFYRPYYLLNTGFQLSFLAVFVVAIVLPRAEYTANRILVRTEEDQWKAAIATPAATMAAVQISTVPITAYLFYYLSLTSFLLNPLVLFLSAMTVPLGMALLFLCLLPDGTGELLFAFVAQMAELTLGIMAKTSLTMTAWQKGVYTVASPPLGLLLLFYGILFFLCSESFAIYMRKNLKKQILRILACILMVGSILPWSLGLADLPLPHSRKTYPIVFVDVGQGDCMHIRTPGGKNILIDGGGSMTRNVGEKVLKPYLLKNGITSVDLAIITHLHMDHYKGITELAEELPVRNVLLYKAYRFREEPCPDFGGATILYGKEGDKIELEQGIYLEIFGPEELGDEGYRSRIKEYKDENQMSIIAKISYKGFTVMTTGDMGKAEEACMLERFESQGRLSEISSDLLKVAHHGSRYSTSAEFVSAVNPALAVIQAGKNNFGHPSADVIELFRDSGIMVGRNDLHGAVVLEKISEDKAVLMTMLGGNRWHIKR